VNCQHCIDTRHACTDTRQTSSQYSIYTTTDKETLDRVKARNDDVNCQQFIDVNQVCARKIIGCVYISNNIDVKINITVFDKNISIPCTPNFCYNNNNNNNTNSDKIPISIHREVVTSVAPQVMLLASDIKGHNTIKYDAN